MNFLYIFFAPSKYESDAQVMVKVDFNNPDLARPDFGGNGNNGGGQRRRRKYPMM